MGGSITTKSSNFISKLYSAKIINRIETRNVELKLNRNIINNLGIIIPEIFHFELEWLKTKLKLIKDKKNNILAEEYKVRISEIEDRLNL